MTTAKIAVSVPRATLDGVEKRRRALGLTRSAVVVAALDAWLADQSMNPEERAYVLGYLRDPETDEERRDGRELAKAAVASWGPWDGPADRRRPRRSRGG